MRVNQLPWSKKSRRARVLSRALAGTCKMEALEDRRLFTLLGINVPFPQAFVVNTQGTSLTYDPSTGAFDDTANLILYHPLSGANAPVSGADFEFHIHLNTIGALQSDSQINLEIDGSITLPGDTSPTYTGQLVLGKIAAFGWAFDPTSQTGLFDARVAFISGSMAPVFQGQDIGIQFFSEASSFTGSFTSPFNGKTKDLVGPIPYNITNATPSSLSGTVFADQNNDLLENGAEQGIPGVTVTLTGNDFSGNPVSLTTTTGPNGAYGFGGLSASDINGYTITETQPGGYIHEGQVPGNTGGITGDHIITTYLPPSTNSINNNFAEILIPTGSLAGTVFCDQNDNGAFDATNPAIPGNPGDVGLGGLSLTLTSTTGKIYTATTNPDGSYLFPTVTPGTYTLSESGPADHIDGSHPVTIGNAGGTLDATPDTVQGITIASNQTATGYNFSKIQLGGLDGFVFADSNNDGQFDLIDAPIAGVKVTLTGTTYSGQNVPAIVATTDASGKYVFSGLLPGVYKLVESQPAGYTQGIDSVGTLVGPGNTLVPDGSAGVQDQFSGVVIAGCESPVNFNFAELGAAEAHGGAATIGFWHNKNGQALLTSLNGGASSTKLGNWLAATFPNLYGASTLGAAYNFAGKTNAQVASFYLNYDFNASGMKVNAQVLSVAFAIYVTDTGLAGSAGSPYGFTLSNTGVADQTINVGSNGAAFGVANNSTITILQAILATNAQSSNDLLYGGNQTLITQANVIYSAINQNGDIN